MNTFLNILGIALFILIVVCLVNLTFGFVVLCLPASAVWFQVIVTMVVILIFGGSVANH